ncbi:hypothetical protein AF40_04544 [Enterobacter roggenkampii MGH 54]|nr:hypothetical protein AF40_04544 [Enterobacter roggenkampii MGH 54]
MMNKTELLTLAEENVKPKPVPLKEAFWFWMKLGFISFGGPAGQIAIMHQELVENRRWISESRFLHALNFCMVLPGPEAQQLATYIGWLMHRTLGGVIAGLLFILPSLFILIALSWIYIAWGDVAIIAGIFYGIKPAVAAIVLQAAHRIGSRALKHGAHWAIAAAAFVAVFALNVPFPVIVISAAITGFIGGRIAPEKFHSGSGHNKQEKAAVDAAVIDDHRGRLRKRKKSYAKTGLASRVVGVPLVTPAGLRLGLVENSVLCGDDPRSCTHRRCAHRQQSPVAASYGRC